MVFKFADSDVSWCKYTVSATEFENCIVVHFAAMMLFGGLVPDLKK
jgi:hypothetical protein